MNPQNQSGSLGFAYVVIDSGAIVAESLVVTGALRTVTRISEGAYRVYCEELDPFVFGISVMPRGDGSDVLVANASLNPIDGYVNLGFYLLDGTPADPAGFLINLLPT